MIALDGVSARAGAFALRDVTFEVPAGGYGVVVGAAGAGKTTLLETVAGLVPQTAGTLRLHGADAGALPPERRDVGLVYQHALLFPHLTVAANVAYGARDAALAGELLERLGARDLADRDVARLSGGERQLVALARALARRPRVLLLDEPFGALDVRRRAAVRRTVRLLHAEWGLTTLHVTHDLAEAGLLGDVLVVLDAGRVLQWGPPADVVRRPASAAAAALLGAENVFAGTATVEGGDGASGADARAVVFRGEGIVLHAVSDRAPGSCHAVVRAEDVTLSRAAPASSARNVLRGTVREVLRHGPVAHVTLDVGGVPLVAALTAGSAEELALRGGDEAWASVKALAVHLC